MNKALNVPDNLQESIRAVSKALDQRMGQLLSVPESDDITVISISPKVETAQDTSHVRGEEIILEAMRYSTLSGGKRLRPFLTVCSAGLFGVSWESAIEAAA